MTGGTPLLKVSLVDRVVEIVQDRIAQGEMLPGETIRIERLARELGVSRTPVREAVSKLEALGLIVRRTGYAATIFMPNRQEVIEYYEMRRALEPLAARLALPKLARDDKQKLRRLVNEMEMLDAPNWVVLNREFHRTIYQAADRPYLVEMLENLIARSEPYQRMAFERHDLEETQRGHREMLDSVLRDDEEALAAAIRDHLDYVVQGMLVALEETGTTPGDDPGTPANQA